MRIVIETVPHKLNRNGQVGDYKYLHDGTLYITVSELGNDDMNWLVALHEMIEERISKSDGISEPEINDWDAYYEKKREMGLVPTESENGFAYDCIYKKHHTVSTGIEMVLAALLEVDWNDYNDTINKL